MNLADPLLNLNPGSEPAEDFPRRRPIVTTVEYLISYGASGEFGRFRGTLSCIRGDRVVVESARGLELGLVLCEARPGHAQFLPNTTVGKLLRRAGEEDLAQKSTNRQREIAFHQTAQKLANETKAPIAVLDAEILLDQKHAVVHVVEFDPWDPRPYVSALSTQFQLHVFLVNLTDRPASPDEATCGRPDCGKKEGGCSTCGTCSSCGAANEASISETLSNMAAAAASQRMPLH